MGWNSSSFPNFNGAADEVWEWKINFIPHFLAMRLLIHAGINADPWFNKGPWSYLRETPCGTMFTWARYPAMYVRHMSSLIIPPATKLRGGILDSHCSSVRLSVCPSVRPSVGRCPDDNSNSNSKTQPFIKTQIKENIKAPRHWPLCGEFTGTGELPAQRASYAENVSIWWRHHVPCKICPWVTRNELQ